MAVYDTSTVTINVGSATVKGTIYTDFTTYVSANDLFQLTDTEVFYTVAAVNTASRLTLSSRYADTSNQTSRSENIASTNNATKCYSGTLSYYPVIQNYVVVNASNVRYTDDGGGILTGTPVTGTPVGTIDYDTGAWTIITATTYAASVNVTASYYSGDELTSQSYQIVRDFTPNYSMPEMSLNDTNFPNIYTNAMRIIDSQLQTLENAVTGSVDSLTIQNNASVFQTLIASELVVKHTASILTLENETGHITTLTSNSITASSLTASGLDIVAHVNNAASDPHNVVSDVAYTTSWNGVTNTAPSKNAVYDKIQLVVASITNVVNDTAYGGSWDSTTKIAPSKNAVYDKIELVVASLATHEGASDPHTGYLLADGTRNGASSQTQNFGANGIAANQINATTITVASLINSVNGEITTLTSNSITATTLENGTGHITTLTSNSVTATTLENVTGHVTTLTSNSVTATTLENVTGHVTTLTSNDVTATSGTISVLDSTTGHVTTLTSNDVTATSGTISVLDSTTGHVTTLTSNDVTATSGTISVLDSTTGHVTTLTSNSVTATTVNISSTLSIAGAYTFAITDGNASECITTDGNGNLSWEPKGAGAGEANTATNLGTSIGTLYKTKSAAELQFRRIAPNSSKIAVSVTATDVKLDVTEAQLSISNMNQTGHMTTLTSNSITATNLVAGGLTYPTSDASASYVLTTNGAGTLSFEPKGAGAGEANTATNLGTSVGTLYKSKDGVVLQFRRIAANSAKVAVSVTATDVKLDVTESELDITNMTQTGHMGTLTSNDVTATVMNVSSSLGINTDSPESQLHLLNGSEALWIESDDAVQTRFIMHSDSPTAGANVNWRKTRGTKASPDAVVDGDRAGAFTLGGWDGDQFINNVAIVAKIDGTVSDNVVPMRLDFETGETTQAARAVRFSILSDGTMGFKTTSPTNGDFEFTGDIYCSADVSALTFTDRTPFYDGDGISDIKNIKGENGDIDHDSLPDFAKVTRTRKIKEIKEVEEEYCDEETNQIKVRVVEKEIIVGEEERIDRDLGAMISVLVKAVQQLIDENKIIHERLDTLKE